MAKTNGFDVGVSLHISRKHSHGISIVKEKSIGTYLRHIVGEVLQYGDRTERAEDAADAKCIGYGLTKSVFLGNFKIDDGTRIVSTDLDGVNNEISAPLR